MQRDVGIVLIAATVKIMNEKSRSEWEKELQEHRCNLCECDPRAHIVYWSCPLFKGDEICQNCCQVDALRPEIADQFSKALGKKMSLDEINEACRNCGKNYGVQNEQLADDIESQFKTNEAVSDEEQKPER